MDARLHVGDTVGPYRIVGELGQGGMGVVYQAVHELLCRPAAIKVLRPDLGPLAMASDRFLTEARATTAIRHPGIVEVYDYGHTPSGQAFIAMELLLGETLGERLRRGGALRLVEALTIARRIAGPLAAAHERGVVHRDL
ncbi:MAG TPA: serine/threonine-protein kinase, partial [Kofleriaceae bacterium]|nr:serine/threonine-protein kinase [Kofleriaceae bacterium]